MWRVWGRWRGYSKCRILILSNVGGAKIGKSIPSSSICLRILRSTLSIIPKKRRNNCWSHTETPVSWTFSCVIRKCWKPCWRVPVPTPTKSNKGSPITLWTTKCKCQRLSTKTAQNARAVNKPQVIPPTRILLSQKRISLEQCPASTSTGSSVLN